jgi:VIT1/CCC1 family predicted Fe2+/Mn2+ transporter
MANLLADGFSMAIGAFLSSKSEKEYYQREWQREAWEVEHFPEGERAELYEVYRSHSYSEEDARRLVDIQARDPQRWVKAMMINELGMLQDERKPLFSALATLVSFILAGFMPLIVYVLGLFYPISSTETFTVSVILSALTIFGLGVAKVTVTKLNPLRSGIEMLLVGGLAASVAYVVGAWLRSIVG